MAEQKQRQAKGPNPTEENYRVIYSTLDFKYLLRGL